MPREISCYAKAVELLARRTHFRRELAAKLAQRGYPEEEIAAALARLAERGLLDDAAAAREFVAARLRRAPAGRRRLLSDLARRGAEPEAAAAAVEEALGDDDLALAAAAAARFRGTSPAALARHLERRGFSRRAIFSVLRGAKDDPDLDLADGEDPC